MAWVRLEDTFPEHPKIATVGGDAAWLHVCGIAYCNRNLTNGKIPAGAVRQLSDRRQPVKLAEALVEAGLWEHTDAGYLIHDYLDYNPSRAEVEAERAAKAIKKQEAGRLGGIASGVSRRKHNGSKHEANREANTNEIEAPTRPDPTRREQVSDNPTSENTPEGVDNSRYENTVTEYARLALEAAIRRGTQITSNDGYKRTSRTTAIRMPELEQYLTMFPTAPASAVAAWLHGEKDSMRYYPRADEMPEPLASVHPLRKDAV